MKKIVMFFLILLSLSAISVWYCTFYTIKLYKDRKQLNTILKYIQDRFPDVYGEAYEYYMQVEK